MTPVKQSAFRIIHKLASAPVIFFLFLLYGFSCQAKDHSPVIMLDPGHDFLNPGATSASGIKENIFNLRFTRELASSLEMSGFTVQMSRSDEESKSLKSRINRQPYDLFISIHHDSVQEEFCYFTEDGICTTYSGYGYSLWVSPKNPFYNHSLKLAKLIGTRLKDAGLIHSVHHVAMENRDYLDRKAGIFSFPNLYVLRHNIKPAILIEVAVITNPADEKNAESPQFRQRFIQAITQGVISYFSQHNKR